MVLTNTLGRCIIRSFKSLTFSEASLKFDAGLVSVCPVHFSWGGAGLRRGGWSSAIWTFTIAYLLRASEVTGMKDRSQMLLGSSDLGVHWKLFASETGSHEGTYSRFFDCQVVLADSTVFAHHSSRRVNGSNNAWCDLLKCVGSPRSYFFYRAWRITKVAYADKVQLHETAMLVQDPGFGWIWILGEAFSTQKLQKTWFLRSKKREDVTLVGPEAGLLFSLIATMIHIFCVAELLGHTALKAMAIGLEEVKLLDCLSIERSNARPSILGYQKHGKGAVFGLDCFRRAFKVFPVTACQLWMFALRRLRQTWCWSRTVSVPMPLGLDSCQNWKSWE